MLLDKFLRSLYHLISVLSFDCRGTESFRAWCQPIIDFCVVLGRYPSFSQLLLHFCAITIAHAKLVALEPLELLLSWALLTLLLGESVLQEIIQRRTFSFRRCLPCFASSCFDSLFSWLEADCSE